MTHSETLNIGSVFAELYRLDSVLGQGAFGIVFDAFDLSLERRVALKLIPCNDEHPQLEQRFMREVQLAKQIEHGNVVHLYNFGRAENMLFIAMELVDGMELAQLIEARGALPIERVLDISLQVLDALAEAQRLGIVHRDLKPENILLTRKGVRDDVVKLLDFGIATTGSDADMAITETGAVCGTPMYMAPEQFQKGELGLYTDIYALGLIMLEMLTGEAVIQAESVFEVIAAHIKDGITLPPFIAQSCLAPVLGRAIHKDPKRRFASALDMYTALSAVAERAKIELSSKNLGEQAKRPMDKKSKPGGGDSLRRQPERCEPGMARNKGAAALAPEVDDFFDTDGLPKAPDSAPITIDELEKEVKKQSDSWWKSAVANALGEPHDSGEQAKRPIDTNVQQNARPDSAGIQPRALETQQSPQHGAEQSPALAPPPSSKPETEKAARAQKAAQARSASPPPPELAIIHNVRGPQPIQRRLWPYFVWPLVLAGLAFALWWYWPWLMQQWPRQAAPSSATQTSADTARPAQNRHPALVSAMLHSATASFGHVVWAFPVKIKYVPSSARLELDGELACRKSPCRIDYLIGARGLLTLSKKGYKTRTIDLQGFKHPLSETLDVELDKD